MTRIIFCAMLAMLLLATSAIGQPYRENICTNPSFEDWSDPVGDPAQWRFFSISGAMIEHERSTDAHDGSYAVLYRWTNAWVSGMDQGLDKQSWRLTVTEGHHYRIRFWAKAAGYEGANIGVRCALYSGASWIRDWPSDAEGGAFSYWIVNPLPTDYTEFQTGDTVSGSTPAHLIPDATVDQCNIRFAVAFGPGSYILDEVVVEDMDLPPLETPTPTPTPFGFAEVNSMWTIYD